MNQVSGHFPEPVLKRLAAVHEQSLPGL